VEIIILERTADKKKTAFKAQCNFLQLLQRTLLLSRMDASIKNRLTHWMTEESWFDFRRWIDISPFPDLLCGHPTSNPKGTDFLSVGGGGGIGQDVKLTTPLHLIPMLKMH
jgi:hypothetical protein